MTAIEAPTARPNLLLARSPFRLTDREFHQVEPGRSLDEILAAVAAPVHRHVLVFIDDRLVPRAQWGEVTPAEGALIIVRAMPEGPLLGANPAVTAGAYSQRDNPTFIQFAVLAAVLVTTVMSAGTLTPLAAAIATSAVAIGTNLAAAALIKPPPVDPVMKAVSRGQNLIDGTRNRIERYAVVPQVLGTTRYVPPQAMTPYSESRGGKTTVTQMFDFGRGPIDFEDLRHGANPIFSEGKTLVYDAKMQSDGYFKKIEVELRRGTPTDAPITLVVADVNEEPLSLELKGGASGPGTSVIRRTLADTEEISVDLTWQGLTFPHNSGGFSSATVVVRIEYAPVGGAWTKFEDFTKTANTTSLIRVTRTWAVTKGQYDVRLTRRTAAAAAGSKLIDKTYWTALRSKRMGDPLKESGHARIVTRITGTSEVNGIIDELSAIAHRSVKAWDGAAWTEAPTRNPAAAFRRVLQDPGNRLAISDANLSKWVDLPRLQELSTYFDSAHRFFDFVFDTESSVLERLRVIAAACRCVFTLRDGKFSMVRDDPAAPVAGVFTPVNSWGFNWQRTWPKLPHGLKVRFQDAYHDWQLKEEIVFDDGYSAAGTGGTAVATEFDDWPTQGVIDPAIVWRDARYHLAVNRLRTMVYRWRADWEYLTCEMGDRVRASFESVSRCLAAGRVKALVLSGSDVAGITLDQAMPMETGKSYALLYRRSSNFASFVKAIVTVAGDQETVSFTTAITVAGEKPAVGDVVSFGEAALVSLELLVTGIRPAQDLTAEIEAVPVEEAVYAADADSVDRPGWAFQVMGEVVPDSREATDGRPQVVIESVQTTSPGTATVTLSTTAAQMAPPAAIAISAPPAHRRRRHR